MEIVYLRILETPSNENLSFVGLDINFRGEYDFIFNAVDKKIELKHNDAYFRNLYHRDIQITGIVGANGVGKTTLLKFIQYLIAKLNKLESGHSYFFDTWNWIAVVNKIDGLHFAKPISDSNAFGDPSHLIDFSKCSFEKVNFENVSLLSTSVFYSPHFDLTEPNFDRPDYIDVSSDFLIYNEASKKEEDDQKVSQIVHFRRNDIKRQIDFIQFADSLANEKINFYNQIKRNNISLRLHEFSKRFDHSPRYIDLGDCELYTELDKNFIGRNSTIIYEYRRERTDNSSELSLLRFYRRLIEIIYDCIEYRPEPKQDQKGNFRPSIVKGFTKDSENITANFESYFQFLIIFESSDQKNEFLELIQRVKAVFIASVTYNSSNESFQCSLKIAQELIIIEKDIFALLPYKSNLELFNFEWSGMSTGEKAYLNLFSRIHHGLNTLLKHPTIGKADLIYLLIDEPATGFHPQWQKEYLFKLLEFVKARLDNKFHIVISSHSSFLISDLQKEDVIALSNNPSPYKIENTFGANIHELLADSFFLQDGFIGDFSKNKIEDLIKYLNFDSNKAIDKENPEPVEDWNLELAQGLINIIGETLIKDRLQEIFNEKFKTIDDLRAEIKKLEFILNKRQQ